MQNYHSIPAVLCACLALVLSPISHAHAATDAANASALRSNLPAGVTLARATIRQTAASLHATVLQHHDDALDLLRIAVLAKTPKQGDGRLPCPDLRRLVQAACTAAPDKTSQLVELANTLDPDCADSLQDLLSGALGGEGSGGNGTNGNGTNGDGSGSDGPGGDFNSPLGGFGPGFPGAPGFVGSTPGNGVALPSPAPAPVTPVTNG